MAAADTVTADSVQSAKKVSIGVLTAMVVGSIVGSGVFVLPRRFGAQTGVLGALIAWTIAGTGMLMPALVFRFLDVRKPDLDAGIFAASSPRRRACCSASSRSRCPAVVLLATGRMSL